MITLKAFICFRSQSVTLKAAVSPQLTSHFSVINCEKQPQLED